MLGRFVDVSHAYRFGPPGHRFDRGVCATPMHRAPGNGDLPLAQCFRISGNQTPEKLPISELGIGGQASELADGSIRVLLGARRFANCVRVSTANAMPDDSWFGIEPGTTAAASV